MNAKLRLIEATRKGLHTISTLGRSGHTVIIVLAAFALAGYSIYIVYSLAITMR